MERLGDGRGAATWGRGAEAQPGGHGGGGSWAGRCGVRWRNTNYLMTKGQGRRLLGAWRSAERQKPEEAGGGVGAAALPSQTEQRELGLGCTGWLRGDEYQPGGPTRGGSWAGGRVLGTNVLGMCCINGRGLVFREETV